MAIDDEIDDEDSKRRQALSEICQMSRHGIVDGVEFDFRHELLDPCEWQMDTIGIEPQRFNTVSSPFIWFPWFGQFSKVKLRDEAKLFYEFDKSRRLDLEEMSTKYPEYKLLAKDYRVAPVSEYIRDAIPECIMYAGDKISVREVRRQFIGDRFDHRHDSEVRYALLNVIRSNGKTENIQKPIGFRGITSIFAAGAQRNFIAKISRRICQHFNARSLREIEIGEGPENDGGKFAYTAAEYAIYIAGRIQEFRELAESGVLGRVSEALAP
jgi:hypothetical protein